jgi:hypothetical protein|tara:strand:- start:4218 stop:4724 length:507 start_codon:yes stop_codon:yes gene_type:complete
MALVVEDGTGKSNADSFISVTDADAYFVNHGSPTAWTGLTTAQKESELRYAAVTLDGNWDWWGSITVITQSLGWPRSGAEDAEGRSIDTDVVPTRVKDAQCELALLGTSNALNSNYDRGGDVSREKVGPIETEYFSGASMEPQLPIINRILGGLGLRRGVVSGEVLRS